MKTALLGISSAVILIIAAPVHAQPAKAGQTESSRVASSKREPVHLVVDSDAKAREVFTYFPYPKLADGYMEYTDNTLGIKPPPRHISVTGLYRLEMDTNGAVAGVKILKSMGRVLDVMAMKAFILWRANPGPTRDVDFTLHYYINAPGVGRAR